MIATLNSFRDTLEDLGGGLGVTDPMAGPVVLVDARLGAQEQAVHLYATIAFSRETKDESGRDIRGRRLGSAWNAGHGIAHAVV
jgi:hypothetical protein